MVLSAYLDASFTSVGGVTSVAGYIAPASAWAAVENEWKDGLSYWGLDTFHYAELPSRLGHEKGGLCAKFFERIITKSQLDGVGSALLDSDWDAPDPPGHEQERLATKYQDALFMALERIAYHAMNNYPGMNVQVFCDADGPNLEIDGVFIKARDRHQNLEALIIGRTSEYLPLQCADLAAGKLRKSWIRIMNQSDADYAELWGLFPVGRIFTSSMWADGRNDMMKRALSRYVPVTR